MPRVDPGFRRDDGAECDAGSSCAPGQPSAPPRLLTETHFSFQGVDEGQITKRVFKPGGCWLPCPGKSQGDDESRRLRPRRRAQHQRRGGGVRASIIRKCSGQPVAGLLPIRRDCKHNNLRLDTSLAGEAKALQGAIRAASAMTFSASCNSASPRSYRATRRSISTFHASSISLGED